MHVVEALLHSASAGGGDAECTTSLSRTTEIFHSHLLALAPNSNIHETEKKNRRTYKFTGRGEKSFCTGNKFAFLMVKCHASWNAMCTSQMYPNHVSHLIFQLPFL